MLKQNLNEKENFPRWVWNLQNLNRQPVHYYCNHRGLYESMVVRHIVYLNLKIACVTSPVFEIQRPPGGPLVFLNETHEWQQTCDVTLFESER